MAGSKFEVDVVGHNRVANNCRAAAAKSKKTMPILRRWGQNTRKKLRAKKYPPQVPGQKYKRTYRLQKSWKASTVSGMNTIAIENTASRRGRDYSGYVVGLADGSGQAYMHKNRWWIAREVVEEEVPKLREELYESIENEFD